jgi:general stress protein 26
MNELEHKIWAILGRPQLAALATVSEAGKPWVRYVSIYGKENFDLRFCTDAGSRKIRHIRDRPDVHLTCGNLRPPNDSAFLQIAGRAAVIHDADEKRAFWREEWTRYFSGPDDPGYVIVEIRPETIEYWAPGSPAAQVWEKS